MGTESQLWGSIKNKFPGDALRIENSVSIGTPDINWCYKGVERWIELKSLPNPIVRSAKIGLRDGQVSWMEKRKINGGKCFVLVRAGERSRRQWFLFDDNLRMLLESQKLETLVSLSKQHWTGLFDINRLLIP